VLSGRRELEVQLILSVKGFTLVRAEKSDGPFELIAKPVELVLSERLRASAVPNVLGDHQERSELVWGLIVCHAAMLRGERSSVLLTLQPGLKKADDGTRVHVTKGDVLATSLVPWRCGVVIV
jgi:hypothetical protein